MEKCSKRVFDGDRHVLEPIELWKDYLAPAFDGHAPYYEYYDHGEGKALADRISAKSARGEEVLLPPDLMVDGEPVMRGLSNRARVELALAAAQRRERLHAAQCPTGQLAAMDAEGIEAAILFPTLAMYLTGVDSMAPELACAFAEAYNDWLRDFCKINPRRLCGAGLIARHDPAWMVAELERVAGFGWRTVVLRPNPVNGRILSHPDYQPFWSACERFAIAVAFHEGTHTRLPTVGAERFTSRFAQHACSHPMEQMMALLALIEGGVLERHPNLRVVFLEAGCGWLPYWLWRLDEIEYKHLTGEVAANVRMKPSEYFRRQCCVAIEPDEPNLAETIRVIGEDTIIFGSDFPHLDHDQGIVGEALKLRERLAEPVMRKLLWDNPARFYGLSVG